MKTKKDYFSLEYYKNELNSKKLSIKPESEIECLKSNKLKLSNKIKYAKNCLVKLNSNKHISESEKKEFANKIESLKIIPNDMEQLNKNEIEVDKIVELMLSWINYKDKSNTNNQVRMKTFYSNNELENK